MTEQEKPQVHRAIRHFLEKYERPDSRWERSSHEFEADLLYLLHLVHVEAAEPFLKVMQAGLANIRFTPPVITK